MFDPEDLPEEKRDIENKFKTITEKLNLLKDKNTPADRVEEYSLEIEGIFDSMNDQFTAFEMNFSELSVSEQREWKED